MPLVRTSAASRATRWIRTPINALGTGAVRDRNVDDVLGEAEQPRLIKGRDPVQGSTTADFPDGPPTSRMLAQRRGMHGDRPVPKGGPSPVGHLASDDPPIGPEVSEQGPGQHAVVGAGGADDRRTSIGGSGHDADDGRSTPAGPGGTCTLWTGWRYDHGVVDEVSGVQRPGLRTLDSPASRQRGRAGQRRRAVPKMLRVISRPSTVPADRSIDFTAEFPSMDSTTAGWDAWRLASAAA